MTQWLRLQPPLATGTPPPYRKPARAAIPSCSRWRATTRAERTFQVARHFLTGVLGRVSGSTGTRVPVQAGARIPVQAGARILVQAHPSAKIRAAWLIGPVRAVALQQEQLDTAARASFLQGGACTIYIAVRFCPPQKRVN